MSILVVDEDKENVTFVTRFSKRTSTWKRSTFDQWFNERPQMRLMDYIKRSHPEWVLFGKQVMNRMTPEGRYGLGYRPLAEEIGARCLGHCTDPDRAIYVEEAFYRMEQFKRDGFVAWYYEGERCCITYSDCMAQCKKFAEMIVDAAYCAPDFEKLETPSVCYVAEPFPGLKEAMERKGLNVKILTPFDVVQLLTPPPSL